MTWAIALSLLAASNGMVGQVQPDAERLNKPIYGTPYVPKNQQLKCRGLNVRGDIQELEMESRWLPNESRTALFVVRDSAKTLVKGSWLSNMSDSLRDQDRKRGIGLAWNATFGTIAEDQYYQIQMIERLDNVVSLEIVSRPVTEENRRWVRDFRTIGVLQFIGRCQAFVAGVVRTEQNRPRLGPVS